MPTPPLVSVSPPVHLCGRRLDGARHVCAFVRSREEEYDVIGPFVKEGLDGGERVLQIVDPDGRGEHAARMRAQGVDVDAPEWREQLSVVGWDEAYLPGGRFDADHMLQTLQGIVQDRRRRGFPLLRAMGNMAWALDGPPGAEQLLEYETRVNLVTKGMPDTFVCTYDVDRFSSSTLIDVMRTHPAVIVGGVYHENPFFVPPEEMLLELRARGQAKRA